MFQGRFQEILFIGVDVDIENILYEEYMHTKTSLLILSTPSLCSMHVASTGGIKLEKLVDKGFSIYCYNHLRCVLHHLLPLGCC